MMSGLKEELSGDKTVVKSIDMVSKGVTIATL